MRVGEGGVIELFDGVTELVIDFYHLFECFLEVVVFVHEFHVPLLHFLILTFGGEIVLETP